MAHIVELSTRINYLKLATEGALGGTGACKVPKAMGCNKVMVTLSLTQNGFGVEGATALAGMLEVNSTLTAVTGLSTNGELIQEAGATALTKPLELQQ